MAFIGDSLSRNHMQSMMCLLSRVEDQVDVSKPDNPYSSWKDESYNFTMINLRSPFLVRFDKPDSNNQANTEIFKLYLDELDDSWTSQIDEFDYIILNVGHWHTRTAIYHVKRRVIGCHNCQILNITELPLTHILGRALRTAFKAINSRRSFHGVTFLRTFSPSHFKGKWNEGGDCPWPKPIIDSWSDFLLHMMKMEKQKSSDQVELFNVNKKMMFSQSEKNK